MPTTQKVSTETILETLAAHPVARGHRWLPPSAKWKLVGYNRRYRIAANTAQARSGSSQLPRPRTRKTPRNRYRLPHKWGTDYPTCGVVALGAAPRPLQGHAEKFLSAIWSGLTAEYPAALTCTNASGRSVVAATTPDVG